MPEVLIIGAGPAGLAAALQLKRRGVDFVLYERAIVGGLLNNANLVENYPGFPGGIKGEKLVELIHRQVTRLGVEITFEEVHCLDYSEGQFWAETQQAIRTAPYAVIASGTIGNQPEDIHIPPAHRERVLTEILPIQAVSGKRIVIIGAGDLAFDYALNLSRRNEVLILNRSRERKCLPLLLERASAIPDITYHEQTQLIAIETGATGSLCLQTTTSVGRQDIACDYLVFAIGRRANTDFLSENLRQLLEVLEERQILHRIGDVKNGIYRQAAIAAGDGILAAMQIIKALEGKRL